MSFFLPQNRQIDPGYGELFDDTETALPIGHVIVQPIDHHEPRAGLPQRAQERHAIQLAAAAGEGVWDSRLYPSNARIDHVELPGSPTPTVNQLGQIMNTRNAAFTLEEALQLTVASTRYREPQVPLTHATGLPILAVYEIVQDQEIIGAALVAVVTPGIRTHQHFVVAPRRAYDGVHLVPNPDHGFTSVAQFLTAMSSALAANTGDPADDLFYVYDEVEHTGPT